MSVKSNLFVLKLKFSRYIFMMSVLYLYGTDPLAQITETQNCAHNSKKIEKFVNSI